MEPQIAFRTGYLWGYLSKRGIDAVPVVEGGNYLPQIDITVPDNVTEPDGQKVTIRVEVIEVIEVAE